MFFKLKQKSIITFIGYRLESDTIDIYFTLKVKGDEMIFGVRRETIFNGVQITQYDNW